MWSLICFARLAQLRPVRQLGDGAGPLVADGVRGVRAGCRAACGRRAASRAASGKAGMPRVRAAHDGAPAAVGVIRASSQDLGEVRPGARGVRSRRQRAAEVHQAGVVGGAQHLGAGRLGVAHLVAAHRRRDVGVLDGEGAAESAALLGAGQLHEFQPADGFEQPARAVAEPEAAAARGRSGGRSRCAGSTRPRRSRRARPPGTRSARTSVDHRRERRRQVLAATLRAGPPPIRG